ncbi:hypothetical protein like AT3G06240 [Hibiscus trionum]|uniref:F-box domain-containing protein n=1 Tax=Hibiscus trionum TaxID=183268 RepID=A0A9W7LW88_HIBTR|nr:hypothetical protein like AT3G06240 [Hibiscus trionum]
MSDYMPEEVILKILNRLPVKSLLRFRSVCKSWNSLISHPSFISAHLQASLSNNNTPFLLIWSIERGIDRGRDNYSLHYDNDGFGKFRQLRFPLFDGVSGSSVVGSCNGLICLQLYTPGDGLKFVLWNPLIQKYISLPRLTFFEADDLGIGFGFDSRTNDYKLIIVGFMGDYGSVANLYLFSLNQNCWKEVTAILPNYSFEPLYRRQLPFANGAVHWFGYKENNAGVCNYVILGFDLSSEATFVINLPESLTGFCPCELPIMKYGESSIAASLTQVFGELHELWVMKEYGVVESWTKVLTFTSHIQSRRIPRLLGFRKNGEVLMEVDNGKMTSFELNLQKIEPHAVEGVEVATTPITHEASYVESLVLLDKGVDTHSGSLVRTGKYIHLLFH